MYIGLDLGTSGLRAVLVPGGGVPVAEATATYPVSAPHPGWSEQDPDDWIAACRRVIADLRASHPAEVAAVRAIGLSGHMHGAVMLDASHRPIRPCILWNDTRAHGEATALDADPRFRALTGNIVFPGFTAPKLVWTARHESQAFARLACVMLPKDFVTLWLTGHRVTDMSDAAGSAWLDTGARAWAPELVAAGGIEPAHLPALAEGCDPIGTLRPTLAAELGLPDGITVVAGGADNAVAACGIGAIREGDGFVSLGTSGVLLAARDRYRPDPATAVHTFCHAIPDRWYQMGVILAATDSLNWLARITGQAPEALSANLGTASGPSSVLFLPYLSGERTPHNDPAPRGTLLGLSGSHDASDLARAVMEGVAFALADSLAALRATGASLPSAMAIGGGSRSRFWVETLAHTLDLPLELPASGDFGAAVGAARLAMIGDGATIDETLVKPPVVETVMPDPALTPAYTEAHDAFRAAYPAIKELT